MKITLQALLLTVAVAVASGCSSVSDVVSRGHALHDKTPATYDALSDVHSEYFEQNPQFYSHGS